MTVDEFEKKISGTERRTNLEMERAPRKQNL